MAGDQTISNPPLVKKKRNLPGTPDPEAEVIALSPKTLLATNRFLCEICGKGFQRDQNLQLHRRGHNLPWKLRQRSTKEPRKRVYVCPEKTCVHNHPTRALGDLTGIKKHFCRKHGEKKWKCDKCSKRYAVQSDWKAHSKTCGTREYRCDCGTLFSRRDSFITHRAFCDALAEETARMTAAAGINGFPYITNLNYNGGLMRPNMAHNFSSLFKPSIAGDSGLSLSNNMVCADPFTSCSDYNMSWIYGNNKLSSPNSGELPNVSNPPESSFKEADTIHNLLTTMPVPSLFSTAQLHNHSTLADMSATALLQKAASIGVMKSTVQSFPASVDMKCHHGSTIPNAMLNMNQNMDSNIHIENLISGAGFMNGGEDEDVYPVKRRAIARDDLGGQTRDFLGVGGFQTLCQPSINGWI
ncbi:putative transcription factor C2H2 family [Dioscorea sansibarensis]